MRSTSVFLAVALAFMVVLHTGTARADLDNEVHNGVKGAVGLGLLGADVTLIIEGAVGVRNPWLLSLIPIAVAGGGAVGGYYIGRESAAASVALLVSGLALMVPAAILVAYGRSYRPSRDEGEGFVDRTEEGLLPEDHAYAEEDPGTTTEVLGPNDEEGVTPPLPPTAEPAAAPEAAPEAPEAAPEAPEAAPEAPEAAPGAALQPVPWLRFPAAPVRRTWRSALPSPLVAQAMSAPRLSLKYY